ncbi:hypothetical protein GCM10022229_19130 [Luteimonas lutimaris]|uniref:Transposase n=1 Tax=Luteimonas lutimaris TaxID=698645 RepID=A0ABP7MKR3_9GAMM
MPGDAVERIVDAGEQLVVGLRIQLLAAFERIQQARHVAIDGSWQCWHGVQSDPPGSADNLGIRTCKRKFDVLFRPAFG